MQRRLGWSETQKGVVLSAFFVGYLLTMAASRSTGPSVRRQARPGNRGDLVVAVYGADAAAALTSLSTLILARIALGLGEAAVFPASINMIGRWVPTGARSR